MWKIVNVYTMLLLITFILLMISFFLSDNVSQADHQYILIGASKASGSFLMADGSWNYSNWMSGQPDNGGGNENCVSAIDMQGYGWQDVDCSLPGIALCQISSPPGLPFTG